MKRAFTTNWHLYRTRLHPPLRPKCLGGHHEGATPSKPERHRDFEELLLDAVDAGLSSLGASSRHAIYFYLDVVFNVRKHEIPHKTVEFTAAIEQIFGEGAKVLQIQIMKHLYEEIGQDFKYFPEADDLLFTDYLEAARRFQEGSFKIKRNVSFVESKLP